MSLPFVNISRLKLDKEDKTEQLREAVAKFESHVYKVIPSSTPVDVANLTAEVNALKMTVAGLSVAVVVGAFPGFGTDYLHVSRGDHIHLQNTFFAKRGSQLATLGSNTLTFDSTLPYVNVPIVTCWLGYADGSFAPIIPDTITTTGITVTVLTLDNSPTIYYIVVGN